MKRQAQIWRQIGRRSALGALIVISALCIGLGGARAAVRNTHAKSQTLRKNRSVATARKATLRRASYKTTTHRRRRRWRRHRVTLPKHPSEQRTEQIQAALERGGYYSGNPNGRWDAATQESLRRFQEANGLPPTGKLDALSLQRMGLGSDVAGVSAPRPITQGNSTTSSAPTTIPKTPGQ